MNIFRLSLFPLLLLPLICLAGSTILPQECWKAMQKVSSFQELHSEANLPPAVASACAVALPKRRLIWAVTDNSYYVLHYEVYEQMPLPGGAIYTNFSIIVATAPKTKGVQPEIRGAGYTRSFKDYRTFVSHMDGPFLGNGD
jgi:hypothetical protein